MDRANAPGAEAEALLLFSFGPVQRFISAARKTSDLWAGSALLSYLAEQALAPVRKACGNEAVIFPHVQEDAGSEASYPNRFVAHVPDESAKAVARKAEAAVQEAFEQVAHHALNRLDIKQGDPRILADRQVEDFLECYWSILSLRGDDEDYGRRYRRLERRLGARKALRDFASVEAPGYRCDLIPSLAALVPDAEAKPRAVRMYWKGLARHQPHSRLRKGEQLSAVALAKRYFPDYRSRQAEASDGEAFPSTSSFATADFAASVLERCEDDERLRAAAEAFEEAMHPLLGPLGGEEDPLPRLRALADVAGVDIFHTLSGEWLFEESFDRKRLDRSGVELSDGLEEQLDKALDALKALKRVARAVGIDPPSKYYALLLLDGDHMGKWLSGEKAPAGQKVNVNYHRAVSRALGHFARHHVPRIVEEEHLGRLVYSGGDDVMAFLSLGDALAAARTLRAAFSGQLDDEVTASAGLVFAHHMQDLGQVLKSARAAEHFAKDALGRDALAFTVMKRSGEHFTTGAKWHADGFDLVKTLRRFDDLVREGRLASGFLYDFEDLVRRLGFMPEEGSDGEVPPPFEGAEEALKAEALRLFKRRSKNEKQASDNYERTVGRLLTHALPHRTAKLLDVAQFLAKGGAR